MKKLTTIFVLLLLAACASAPTSKPAPVSESSKVNNIAAKSDADTTTGTVNNADIASSKLASELNAMQKQSVYFDFDRFAVKPEYLGVIQQQATFIKGHKNDYVTVEGNTDERGSDEYNLSLGDKRANAVRKNLELLGVSATQINAVSLGEEKPRLSCHEEKCWQENRRADFVHRLN
jgi:peptidoglycan-associated lipoprotein